MNKWLFKSQDLIAFLFGAFSGFGINLITGKLEYLSVGWWVFGTAIWTIGFFWYKFWINTVDEFEFFVNHGVWKKKTFDSQEIWICSDTDEYQLITWGVVVDGFKEKWTEIFPDNENNASYKLFLKRNGIIVREFTWVSCDGGRIWMPIPEGKNLWDWKKNECNMEYYFLKDSLDFKMLKKIGYSLEMSFDEVFKNAGITIK